MGVVIMGSNFVGVRSERLPSDDDFNCGYRMVRSSAGRTIDFVSWSHDMLGMRTHYWRGRTGPCWEVGCEACTRGMRSRWNGYLLGQLFPSGENVIFEFTPPAGRTLDESFKEYATMRGLKCRFTRTSEKVNARVHVAVRGMWEQAHTIKLVPDTWSILMRIWGLTKGPDGIIGPMVAQQISEAENLEGQVKPKRSQKPNKIPQTSLLRTLAPQPCQADPNELLEAIARSTFADGGSSARVNGRKKKE